MGDDRVVFVEAINHLTTTEPIASLASTEVSRSIRTRSKRKPKNKLSWKYRLHLQEIHSKNKLPFLDGSNLTVADYKEAVSLASKLKKGARFEGFNPTHMEYASALLKIFFSMCFLSWVSQTALHDPDGDVLFSEITLPNLVEAIEFTKRFVNEYLFNYVMCVVLRHRADASQLNIQLPSHICTQPEMYINMAEVNGAIQNQKTGSQQTTSGTLEVG